MIWSEKYKPSFNEIYGQEEAKVELLEFIKNFSQSWQGKKAAMIYGPSGTGKTALVHAIASKLNYEIIELNASDLRNKEMLQKSICNAVMQKSLFARNKIILVDEIEGLSSFDRGAIPELLRTLEKTSCPIIFTANDAWQEKIRKIRVKTQLIKFESLDKIAIIKILQKVTQKEKLKINTNILEIIAVQSQGDARAAINDLQSVAQLKEIKKENLEFLREKDNSIFNALKTIFKSKNALNAFDNVQLDINDFFLWLDENLPREYEGKDLTEAYNMLSKADVFRGRIRRQQHWRFLVYISALISQGIALAKKESRKDFTSYKPPSRILKLWLAKQKLMKKKSISEKIAKVTHCSKHRAQQEFPLLQIALKQNAKIHQELRLEPEEIEFLKK